MSVATRTRTRTPSLIDRVRTHRLALVNCNSYLPADLVRLAKIAGVDRDAALRLLSESVSEVSEWPENVIPITGMSGVIAQVLRDYFAADVAGAGAAGAPDTVQSAQQSGATKSGSGSGVAKQGRAS